MPKRDGVNIAGFDATMKALREYDEIQYKEIQKRIKGAAKKIADKAKSNIQSAGGLSNWGAWTFSRDGRDLSFDASRVGATIKVTKGTARFKRQRGRFVTNAIGIVTTDAAAQIFHTMGNAKKPGARSSAYGETMRGNFAAKVDTPRGLWAAQESEGPMALEEIQEAVHEAERITNRITD